MVSSKPSALNCLNADVVNTTYYKVSLQNNYIKSDPRYKPCHL